MEHQKNVCDFRFYRHPAVFWHEHWTVLFILFAVVHWLELFWLFLFWSNPVRLSFCVRTCPHFFLGVVCWSSFSFGANAERSRFFFVLQFGSNNEAVFSESELREMLLTLTVEKLAFLCNSTWYYVSRLGTSFGRFEDFNAQCCCLQGDEQLLPGQKM